VVVVPVKGRLQRVVQVDERQVAAGRDRAADVLEPDKLGLEDVVLLARSLAGGDRPS